MDNLKEYKVSARPVKAGENITALTLVANETATGMLVNWTAAGAAVTAGRADITNTGALGLFAGAAVPAFAPADYNIDLTFDGGAVNQVTVSLLAADDWDGVAAKIQAASRLITGGAETVAVAAGVIRVTSDTTGAASSVLIAAGTAGSAGGDLLAAITALGADYTATLAAPVAGKDTEYNRVYLAADDFDNTLGADGIITALGGLRYCKVYTSDTILEADFNALAADDAEKLFYGFTATQFSINALGVAIGRIRKVYNATTAEVVFN